MNRNKNTLFILPIYNRSLKFYGKNFENIYIDPENDRELKLVFRQSPKNETSDYLVTSEYFVSTVQDEEKTIFTLRVPERFQGDLDRYKKGQYSKLSKEFKNLILTLNANSEHYHDLGIIMFPKDKDRKALEVRLGATLPKNSEIFDIIGENEYFSKTTIR